MKWSFGGHETFIIREGWLHKGLSLLLEDPHALAGPNAADALGVGQNMAKSIRHWLVVTGLAERTEGLRGPLKATEFGNLVWDQDPYFLAQGTWWAVHMQLINQPRAGAWCWFFNHFSQPRFERAVSVDRLHHHLQLLRKKAPSRNTLDRDISCLLRCYATAVPPKPEDPEDGNDCGLRELGLLFHFPGSGVFQRNTDLKSVPIDLIGFNIALGYSDARGTEGTVELSIDRLARDYGGPGAALQMRAENLYELLQTAEQSSANFVIAGLGAERVLRLPRRSPIMWLENYYAGLEEAHANAA